VSHTDAAALSNSDAIIQFGGLRVAPCWNEVNGNERRRGRSIEKYRGSSSV
jgi:hypothetical protein